MISAFTWPDELELELTEMAQGGYAVGRYADRPIFASGGLPGEQVHVRLHDRQGRFARGHVAQVLRPVPERIASPCPLEDVCGAADWRWIAYGAQLRFKTEILRNQLRHLGGIEVDVRPPAPSLSQHEEAAYAYRTTAELHIDGTRIGYYRPGSRRVADLPTCCLHHPALDAALQALRPLLRSTRVTLRSVTIRCSPTTGQVLGILDGRGALRELATAWRQAHPVLVGVAHARDGAALTGQAALEHHVAGLRFRVSAQSFFQINYRQLETLVTRVKTLLAASSTSRLLDLYCGVGLFALAAARDVAAVTGIEEWQPAVADARHNAELNRIGNAAFHVGAAEQMLAIVADKYDRVVLDPPRRGCASAVLQQLAHQHPPRIVYVSCHPGTLARDCRLLSSAGYGVTSAEVIDLFPQTHHIESIVLLERR